MGYQIHSWITPLLNGTPQQLKYRLKLTKLLIGISKLNTATSNFFSSLCILYLSFILESEDLFANHVFSRPDICIIRLVKVHLTILHHSEYSIHWNLFRLWNMHICIHELYSHSFGLVQGWKFLYDSNLVQRNLHAN